MESYESSFESGESIHTPEEERLYSEHESELIASAMGDNNIPMDDLEAMADFTDLWVRQNREQTRQNFFNGLYV